METMGVGKLVLTQHDDVKLDLQDEAFRSLTKC